MRISKKFNLKKTQRQLDFVDIDINCDTPLFIDPYFIGTREDNWSINAHRTIENFFQHILSLYKSNNFTRARQLFESLGEPNETCLGISTSSPNGKGIGVDEADDIFTHLHKSNVIQNGIVSHFEDLVIFVDNVGKDKISDLTTNIIRKHLIDYTISQCELHKIPLVESVPTGYYWDDKRMSWQNTFSKGLVINDRIIILVPKWIVSYSNVYTKDQYAQHFVLNFLQNEHLRINSRLVRTRVLKNGEEKKSVAKKDIAKEEGVFQKEYLRDFTLRHPEVFQNFRNTKRKSVRSMSNSEIYDVLKLEEIEIIDHLINQFSEIPTGAENATNYHKLVTGVMEYILYPHITRPIVEDEIHEGRKRIDISFDNSATDGFFYELHKIKNIPCSYIFVECKNYTKDIKNPEIDQIAGRFSPNRGNFGFIVFREAENFDMLLKRCSDTFNDSRGCIMPLKDSDFIELLVSIKEDRSEFLDGFLKDRLRKIIVN